MEFLNLSTDRKRTIFLETAAHSGLPVQAIEKDWWVTLCLRVLFSLPESEWLIFKGGTSLSKGWGLIERFSEDIDLSISRAFLGYGSDDISNNQIKKLRKASFAFVSGRLAEALQIGLEALGLSRDAFQLSMPIAADSDVDPQTIYVAYAPHFEPITYLPPRVKIEVGARAMMEPSESRPLRSMIGSVYPDAAFADAAFPVTTVLPKRTFLEKLFLLHETLQLDPSKVGDRLSRHLYDIDRLMDTPHGLAALEDHALFCGLADFRRRFNTIKAVNYDTHTFQEITFVPSAAFLGTWERDYKRLQENMIFGNSRSFAQLLTRLEALQQRFRMAATVTRLGNA